MLAINLSSVATNKTPMSEPFIPSDQYIPRDEERPASETCYTVVCFGKEYEIDNLRLASLHPSNTAIASTFYDFMGGYSILEWKSLLATILQHYESTKNVLDSEAKAIHAKLYIRIKNMYMGDFFRKFQGTTEGKKPITDKMFDAILHSPTSEDRDILTYREKMGELQYLQDRIGKLKTSLEIATTTYDVIRSLNANERAGFSS